MSRLTHIQLVNCGVGYFELELVKSHSSTDVKGDMQCIFHAIRIFRLIVPISATVKKINRP